MSTRERLIKARLGMLALAEELQNISLVCSRAGISRSHFYEIKEAYARFKLTCPPKVGNNLGNKTVPNTLLNRDA